MSAPQDDYTPGADSIEGASGADTTQNDYKSRTGQSHIPVQNDEAPVEDPIDPNNADSDEQLARDDTDAIDQGNIVDERTRGATKNYREPGDEEGLPGPEDGSSRVAGGPN
ncbi:uncharacterized protein PV06_02216 [Exophiala oligosperma]|uniref:Histone chaperone domain-containing protein n=2 Tax=Chaetothyriales TaxID=34395 RepID=A0A0D2EF54_9EURO|nr:uncharacterized protein PV06_02216 [Exophiala oligosperma]KAJ9629067.1 hypothetical protein H2204_009007 [Knufia peltigerae]KIW46549.1 hypothetical protein PV06_02216 [Exophiala oligosperma]